MSGKSKYFKSKPRREDYENGENVYNLLHDSEGDHDKWIAMDVNKSWVEFTFASPVIIRGYGLKSANDCPNRSPRIWKLELMGFNGDLEKVIH